MTSTESPTVPPPAQPAPGENRLPVIPETTDLRRHPNSPWQLVFVALLLGALGGLALIDLVEINADYERMVQTLQRPLF